MGPTDLHLCFHMPMMPLHSYMFPCLNCVQCALYAVAAIHNSYDVPEHCGGQSPMMAKVPKHPIRPATSAKHTNCACQYVLKRHAMFKATAGRVQLGQAHLWHLGKSSVM